MCEMCFWSFTVPNLLFRYTIFKYQLILCCDIESNPGPPDECKTKSLNIGHVDARCLFARVSIPGESKSISKFELTKNHILYND